MEEHQCLISKDDQGITLLYALFQILIYVNVSNNLKLKLYLEYTKCLFPLTSNQLKKF